MNITKRLGTFFWIVGLALLVLFFASDYLEQPNGGYLLFGAVLFGLGIALSRRGRERHEPAQRFRLMRRMFGNSEPEEKKPEEDQEME
jgi:hypothetical protein